MKKLKHFGYTVFNIVAGGMALSAAIISYGRASHPDALYFYLIGLLTWIFALITFILKPENNVVRVSYLLSIGLMSVCSVDATFSINEQGWESIFVPLFQFLSACLLPCLFFRYFATFPSVKWFAKNRLFKWGIYIPGILLFIAMFDAYLDGNSYQRSFFLIHISYLLIPNAIFLFSFSIAGQVCLLHTWLYGETVRQQKQAKWLLLGISLGIIPLTFFNTIPYLLEIELPYNRFPAYTLIMIPICYGIAIMKYRLMDIEFVLNRSLVYTIVSGVTITTYLLSSQVLGKIFSTISPKSGVAVRLFSILIVALLFAPMKQRIQEFIDRYFYHHRYNYRETLNKLGETLSTTLKFDELGETILDQLSKTLQPEFIALLLMNKMLISSTLKDSEYQIYRKIGDENKLMEALKQFDPESTNNMPEMINRDWLTVPLISKGQRMGFILLGKKLSGKDYNIEDIYLMKMLSHQVAISIENASIYERLREEVRFMKNAYDRLFETFRESYPDLLSTESAKTEDIILELDMIADALVKSSEKLRELDELKSQFLSNVSHELRTPLASIKGYADNLLDGIVGDFNGKQRRYIERISQNCERLVRMINDLLNLSRIEAGKFQFTPTKFSLSSLVNDIVFEFNSITEKKDISLTFNCSHDVTLFADGDKLREIIINLIDNAIKFTNSGGKVLVNVNEREQYVDISVEDTGKGIPPGELNDIFDRFHQIQQKEKGKSKGIGIGLAIVKSLVELHNGEITVQSKLGEGSKFTVTLPKKDCRAKRCFV